MNTEVEPGEGGTLEGKTLAALMQRLIVKGILTDNDMEWIMDQVGYLGP